MKEVLTLIEKKKQDFARLPLFDYMQDRSIDPRQRLAFAPCMAPFVMSFRELNQSVFRQEPTIDPLQVIINKHTREEDCHWIWFLEDLEKLGFDLSLKYSDALRFIWSEKTQKSRHAAYELYRYAHNASSLEKLVIIEAEEATAEVFLSISSQVILEIQSSIYQEYRYFGTGHLAAETDHSYAVPETQQLIKSIEITKEDSKYYCDLVEQIFEVFIELLNEFLNYAKAHDVSECLITTSESKEIARVVKL